MRTAATGSCGLCLEVRELQDSHLVPKAVYRLCRTEGASNPNPVVTTPEGVALSSDQVSAPLLCADCEDRLSKNGEQYVLSQCARRNGKFKARDLLRQATPVRTHPAFAIYAPSDVPQIRVDRFLYFGASVFWRAGARRWRTSTRDVGIDLGRYGEGFRTYLMGEAPFPAAARLFVHVWREEEIKFMTVFPCSERIEGVWRHKFAIPGFLFILFVGKDAPLSKDAGAINSVSERGIWLCSWESDSLFRLAGEVMMGAPMKSPELKEMRARVKN
jgi:hypothetical protein